MLYEKIYSECERLTQEISSLQARIRQLPEGKLACTHSGGYTKWYQSDAQHLTYIPKKNRGLAEELAAKKYLMLHLEELLHEQKAIDSYLRYHAAPANSAEHLLSEDSPYRELLSPYFAPASQELLDWMTQPYDHNIAYPEQRIHKTNAGILVRSKSEALITNFLYRNKLPFRYECALHLSDTTLYPDFTILHPQTRQTLYWEHFGMMDNPGYCKNAFSKLQLYTSNGILPSVHLLTTYETKEHPLDYDIVDNLIKFYFL